MTAQTAWELAARKVRALAGTLPIYWGTGNPIHHPHIVAWKKDAWSGEGLGYNVCIYPQGSGYLKPTEYHSIPLATE